MDEVEITEEGPYHVVPEPPKNQDLTSLFPMAGTLLSQYGWYLLLVSVLGYVIIQYLSKKRSRESSSSSDTQSTQDAAFVARRQEAMDAARRKMQEELDAKALIFKEKQKQQEEEKRRQKIEMWETMKEGKSYKGSGNVSQSAEEASSSTAAAKPKSDKKPLRSADYNPLSGGGGSCTWRPGRRGPSSGG